MADEFDTRAIDKISHEIAERLLPTRKIAWRMRVWRLTVASSYALKRFVDFTVASAVLLGLLPFFALIAAVIKFTSPGPVLYRQIRVGRFGRHFSFYKFRSMYIDADRRKAELLAQNQSADGVIFKMKNDPRVTRFGAWMRKYSVDELPQFFNVLLGDMSLVGPRPPLPSEVREYTLEDRKRLNILPGLTCIWQISGRSDIPFSQQVQLDKEYIASHGFWRDAVILIKTVPAVLTGRGAY